MSSSCSQTGVSCMFDHLTHRALCCCALQAAYRFDPISLVKTDKPAEDKQFFHSIFRAAREREERINLSVARSDTMTPSSGSVAPSATESTVPSPLAPSRRLPAFAPSIAKVLTLGTSAAVDTAILAARDVVRQLPCHRRYIGLAALRLTRTHSDSLRHTHSDSLRLTQTHYSLTHTHSLLTHSDSL